MASTSNPDNSRNTWLWQNPELADVSFSVVFTTSQESSSSLSAEHQPQRKQPPRKAAKGAPAGPADSTSSRPTDCATPGHTSNTRKYLLHSQVISSGSAFLRASLTSSVGAAKRKRDIEEDACRWHLHAVMDAQFDKAVDAVLQHMYTQQLDKGILGTELLNIMQVADLWQATGAAEAASRSLCHKKSVFPIAAAYTLPSVLKASSAFALVMAAAEKALLAAFGYARDIITTFDTLQQFLLLPQPALLALLQSSKLTTDTEDSVLLLVSSWLAEPTGKACSVEQIEELHHSIRYGRLSRPYLTEIGDTFHLPQLTRKQLAELWAFCSLASDVWWSKEKSHNPSAWYLPARPTPNSHETGLSLKLVATKAELKLLLADIGDKASVRALSSPPVYADGFLWTLKLQLEEGELWCAVSAHGVASVNPITSMDIRHGEIRTISIQLQAYVPVELHPPSDMPIATVGSGSLMTGSDGACPDSAQLGWWEKCMADGCVRLTAITKAVPFIDATPDTGSED